MIPDAKLLNDSLASQFLGCYLHMPYILAFAMNVITTLEYTNTVQDEV